MRGTYSFGKRLLALLLCIAMVAAYLPGMSRTASAASTDGKTVDPYTIHEWKQYFGADVMSTEYAGGVWTDKSVFKSFADYQSAEGVTNFVSPVGNAVSDDVKQMLATDPESFLVALSAITANKSVSGSSSSPLDTMLVLDVSGSMQGNNAVAMVQATNQTIKTLLDQNTNNRIGVVLYSGNHSQGSSNTGTASVLLPLGRYTTTNTMNVGNNQTIPAYLTISGSGNGQTVSVASSVNNGNTDPKTVRGGTYIQNGLFQAWEEFEAVTDTKVPAGQVQAGAQRTPVIVLMSDGAPTAATTSYNDIGTSNMGDGTATNNRIAFVTQLTAAWVRSKVGAHYKTNPLFYTLGVGTGNSSEATSVLNPAASNDTLNTYWNRYLAGTDGQNVRITTGNNSWSVYKDANVTAKNYVDNYWLASSASDLIAAFKQIVNNIVLQAEQHSTLVEAEQGADMSGYVTFEDELGELMEVKTVKGLTIGNMIFTGAEMAKDFNVENMGTVEEPTAYGDAFIATVKERLGIADTAVAQQLVANAYNAGQLSYTSATEYSNYIGWYADENGNYMGFWQESDGYGAEAAPAGAVYINKSYGYLGEQSSAADASDMMHVVVMVHTRISDGHQTVVYKIPASLIPAVTYNVELNGNDPSDVKSITRDAADPLRLLVEVGLRDEINAVNMEDKIAEHIERGGHVHENADGTYTFYTNQWGDGHGGQVNYDEPLSHLVTESHFHPALENERYYHVTDALVYSDASGTVYNGSAAPEGDGYYFARTYYEVVGGTAKYTVKYAPLAAVTLTNAVKGDNGWYIPAGTPQTLTRFAKTKVSNDTETLNYAWNPVVLHDAAGYNSFAFLGNNGSFNMAPAQGIALTKTVSQVVAGAPTEFTFTVTLDQAMADLVVTDTNGDPIDAGKWSVSGNVITVKLSADETVVITGIPTGTTYTVEEEATGYYTASIDPAVGTVAAHTITDVNAVNQPRVYNDLIISKDVLPPAWLTDITALENQEFSIRVTITGADANTTYTTSNSVVFTTDAQGTASQVITLKDAQSLTVYDLPEGAAYSVAEVNVPAGHTANATESAPITGTIPTTGYAQAAVTNTYNPDPAEVTINLSGTKTFLTTGGNDVPDNEWPADGFIMELYHIDMATGAETLVQGDIKVTAANKNWSASVTLSFDKTGVYNYKIVEKAGTATDITYDGTNGLFEIIVSDDASGTLKVSQVIAVQGTTEVTANNGEYTVDKDFTNYKDAGVARIPVQKIIQGSDSISVNDFLFGLYNDQGDLIDTVVGNGAFVIAGFAEDFVTAKQYTVTEIVPNLENRIVGMTYDPTVYNVTVQWDDVSNVLVASVEGTTENKAVFTNTYTETVSSPAIALSGSKNMTGDRDSFIAGESYTIELYQTGADFNVSGLTPVQTETVSGTDYDFGFAGLTFKEAGVYYYVVREAAGSQAGVSYDAAEYHVTIHVVKAVDGNATVLRADAVIHKLGENDDVAKDALDFTNTYTITGSEDVTISGIKHLEGRELIAGEFEFGLYEGSALLQSVKNRTNGTFDFAPITYTAADLGTHTYTVREIIPAAGAVGITYDENTVYTVVVNVTDNGQGGLNVAKTVNGQTDTSIEFTNYYQAGPTSATISGTKTLYDVDADAYLDLTEGRFAFELYNSNANFSEQGDMRATSNGANGAFSFTVNYTTAGDYYYILRERIGDEVGIEYDASRYLIRVRVSDDNAGQLHAATFITHEGIGSTDIITFGNRYDALPGSGTLAGTKVLTGRDIADGEFFFDVFEGNTKVTEGANDGNTIVFEPIEYTAAGEHTYIVKERIPAEAVNNVYKGVTYDTREYTVTVEVKDNGDGTLTATPTYVDGPILFENTYTPAQITVELPIEKTVQSLTEQTIGPEGFKFQLVDENGKQLGTVESDKQGKAKFSLVFQAEDIGRTFKAVVSEIDTKKTGVVYSLNKYAVEITISQADSGELVPTVTIDGKPAAAMQFVNVYEPAVSPVTGDGFYSMLFISLMILSSFGLAAVIVSKKKEEAKESIQ